MEKMIGRFCLVHAIFGAHGTGRTRGRVGWAVDAWLPYVAGGLSVTRANLDITLNCLGRYYTGSEAKTLAGFNSGGGVEHPATRTA